MTDTNMTDANTPYSGGVLQDCGKHVRVLTTQKAMKTEGVLPLVVCVVSWSAVQCLAQHQVLCWVCWW